MTKRFWVVMGESGLSTRPYKHGSEESAFEEAKRLARQHGGTFFVLEAKASAALVDVKIEKFGDRDEIPF